MTYAIFLLALAGLVIGVLNFLQGIANHDEIREVNDRMSGGKVPNRRDTPCGRLSV